MARSALTICCRRLASSRIATCTRPIAFRNGQTNRYSSSSSGSLPSPIPTIETSTPTRASYSRRPPIIRSPPRSEIIIPDPANIDIKHQHENDALTPVNHMKLLTTEDTPNQKTDNMIYFAVFASSMVFYIYMIVTHVPEIQSLIPDDFRPMMVQEVIPLTHDSMLMRFCTDMPIARRAPWDEKGIPIPSHVVIKDHTCEIGRKYTPVTYATNHFDVVVKVYPEGSVSRFLGKQLAGDKVYIRGPLVSMPYESNMADEIGMIAGGTGITPMYQLIKRILRNPDERTRITLLYGSKSEKDILLHNELEILQSAHPDRFKVHYIVDEPLEATEWKGERGFVSQAMIQKYMPPPTLQKSLVLVCGPEGMVRHVAGTKRSEESQGPISGILGQLGYGQNQVFKF
ncbi:hypothetical protein SmJEL517_g02000 [Synchytrium microbalum]|uniref:FAD-binding FR-type domain-containing protein n=1 Tax=Synchytrium microbalum TaxID=1806994 RepID=A0A507C2M6_9FUNG|nr:uncharacterized protein SmJEL517_g02000 [Synchytrium microbalum]TPX35760.1 hypothetical protein SmJEL517_g02000 [Synchytrium microbalum]